MRISITKINLTAPQSRLLDRLREATGVTVDDSILVSGNEYRTALALEARGLASVRYQGPTMGWARLAESEGDDRG